MYEFPKHSWISAMFIWAGVCATVSAEAIARGTFLTSPSSIIAWVSFLVTFNVGVVSLVKVRRARREIKVDMARVIEDQRKYPEYDVDDQGLRMDLHWEFVAQLEHDNGYAHTTDTLRACKVKECREDWLENHESVGELVDRALNDDSEAMDKILNSGILSQNEFREFQDQLILRKDKFGRRLDTPSTNIFEVTPLTTEEQIDRLNAKVVQAMGLPDSILDEEYSRTLDAESSEILYTAAMQQFLGYSGHKPKKQKRGSRLKIDMLIREANPNGYLPFAELNIESARARGLHIPMEVYRMMGVTDPRADLSPEMTPEHARQVGYRGKSEPCSECGASSTTWCDPGCSQIDVMDYR